MNPTDIDEYFPRATREQRIAISVYHDAGWTVEMPYDSDRVLLSRPNTEWVDRTEILPNGRVVSI